VWVGPEGDYILVCTSEAIWKAKDMRRDPRVAMSVTDMANPYRMAAIQGRVVEVRFRRGLPLHGPDLDEVHQRALLEPRPGSRVLRYRGRKGGVPDPQLRPPSGLGWPADWSWVMSLPARQQRALDRIEYSLHVCEPHPKSMFAIFTKLTGGEEMPRPEELQPRSLPFPGRRKRPVRPGRKGQAATGAGRPARRASGCACCS